MSRNRLIARQHPLFSPVALAAALLLLIGLAIVLYLTGGRAFSPGELSAVGNGPPIDGFEHHAAFGDTCTACHTPLGGVEDDNCLACHQEIADSESAGEGVHGLYQELACRQCHGEHEGESHDLKQVALERFTVEQHAQLYVLEGRHAEVECTECHVDDQYRTMDTECRACHAEPEEHAGLYGIRCASCHVPAGWENATMAAHRFPLDHAIGTEVPCVACHTTDTFTLHSCDSCHEHAPATMAAAHAGVDLGDTPLEECTACHTEGTPAETAALQAEN